MNIEHNASESWTLWQNEPEEGIAEPAILVEKFDGSDCITISQNGNRINIGYTSIDDFCKHLKKIMK